ncbi:hypothetical protein QTJ16_006505 [Diplocarpon rosae]|uniref:Aminoglycoside phosphotransferase domain-containing protein n=1 Tax=Diplocarpon rosae TaxID=946125 RepID=A0AAD9SUB5_9HELO|nr:hypothetical protein QTJ16_006505 [Diplocarpon rosae]
MFCEMTPPIGKSVRRPTQDCWILGSSKVCERITTPIPSTAIISWENGDGTFYLRERVEEDLLLREDGSETGLVHEGGTTAAVWSIGVNAFCKVKAWREGMELESKTIEFVKEKVPEVPVPEVIYAWIDRLWNRTFLILRRVKGQTLDEEWSRLTPDQRMEIAHKVVTYCSKLALMSAPRVETATGQAIAEPFFNSIADASHPSWLPRLMGPFSSESLASHLSTIAPGSRLEVGDHFYFYHADLGPTNIMVLDSAVTGIIDWESAAYYPKFWIATKPRLSAGFYLQKDKTDHKAWSKMLGDALEAGGFLQNIEGYDNWNRERKCYK